MEEEEEEQEVMVMEVSEKFNLEKAVCNHGFFMMPPNRWIPSLKCLMRPLSHHLTLQITQPPNKHYILITLVSPNRLSLQHKHSVRVCDLLIPTLACIYFLNCIFGSKSKLK